METSVDILSIGQISPTEIRGALGSVNQLFICIGILAALVAGLPLAGNPLWYIILALFIIVSHGSFAMLNCVFTICLETTEHAFNHASKELGTF